MTRELKKAFEQVGHLPKDDQDMVREMVLAYVHAPRSRSRLSTAQARDVRKAQQEVRKGKMATARQVTKLWKSF